MVLRDIVYDVNPRIRRRLAGEAIEAGDAVYISGDEEVSRSTGPNCNGRAFDGIAMDSVTKGEWLGVATPPTEVYANASGPIEAGRFIVADAEGKVSQAKGGGADPLFIGYALRSASNNIVLMKLMPMVNATAVVND